MILACVCLKVFEKRVLRKIFWPKGADVIGHCRKLHMRSCKTFTHRILCNQIEENERGRACGMYREEGKCIDDFDGGNLKECGHLEDKGICGKVS